MHEQPKKANKKSPVVYAIKYPGILVLALILAGLAGFRSAPDPGVSAGSPIS
jgi:hypothetical protein